MLQRAWIPISMLAAALAGLVLWRSFEVDSPSSPSKEPTTAGQSVASLSDTLGLISSAPLRAMPGTSAATQLVDYDPLEEGGTVHAEAVDVPRPVTLPGTIDHATPGALPRQNAALPIDVSTAAADRALDELIARELADLPEQQRIVWRDVLQGLPAKEAGEILQIWKLTGQNNRDSPAANWPSLIPEEIAPPVATSDTSPADSRALPAEMATVIRENLRHVATPGFIRRNPDRPQLLDLTPGELEETQNPLHLAVKSAHFLMIRRGDQIAFTRNGEFDLNDHRQLVQHRHDGEWQLEPMVELPANAVKFEIRRNGSVVVAANETSDKWTEVIAIPVVMFLNPQHLQRLEGDL
ncbi:MAG: hypothetical protein ACK5Q5_07575, partial [Planctomycetaceae bacterium]